MGAKYFDVYGRNISIDDYPTMVASPDNYIHLTTWSLEDHEGEISIGKYCLLTPGVRIASASKITIGDGCMFANSAYISDADWHGIYIPCQSASEIYALLANIQPSPIVIFEAEAILTPGVSKQYFPIDISPSWSSKLHVVKWI